MCTIIFSFSIDSLSLFLATAVENPARAIDLDNDFSFEKIYGGDKFQETSPMQRNGNVRKPATPGSGGMNNKATPTMRTTPKEPEERTPPTRKGSLTSSVFGWASGEKEK